MAVSKNPSIPKRGQGKVAAQSAPPRSSLPILEEVQVCVDKEVPNELVSLSMELAIAENADNIPILPFGTTLEPITMAMVTGKKWQVGRTINCAFMGGEKAVQDKIIVWAKEWEKYANLKFNFITDLQSANIRIAFDKKDGSWSYIGTDVLTIAKSEPTMNFGWLTVDSPDDEYSRVVLHEFGHAIGFIHEHQHPTVGIPWNKDAVYKYYTSPPNSWSKESVDHNIFRKYSKSITQFSDWDKGSIMSYAVPKSLTDGAFSIGWNRNLSETDKNFVGQMYPFPKSEDDVDFVRRLSILILNREPAQIELDNYTNEIRRKGRMVVIETMEYSRERTDKFAKEFFSLLLKREPNNVEKDKVFDQLSRRITEEQIIASIVASDEFLDNNNNIAKAVYSSLLTQDVDIEVSSDRYEWTLTVLRSQEWRSKIINNYYNRILERNPSVAEVNAWVNIELDLIRIRMSIEGGQEFYER